MNPFEKYAGEMASIEGSWAKIASAVSESLKMVVTRPVAKAATKAVSGKAVLKSAPITSQAEARRIATTGADMRRSHVSKGDAYMDQFAANLAAAKPAAAAAAKPAAAAAAAKPAAAAASAAAAKPASYRSSAPWTAKPEAYGGLQMAGFTESAKPAAAAAAAAAKPAAAAAAAAAAKPAAAAAKPAAAAARGAAKPARTFTQGTLKNIRPVAPGSKPVGVPYMPAKSSKGGFNMDSARKALKDRRVQLGLVGAAGAATGYAAG